MTCCVMLLGQRYIIGVFDEILYRRAGEVLVLNWFPPSVLSELLNGSFGLHCIGIGDAKRDRADEMPCRYFSFGCHS